MKSVIKTEIINRYLRENGLAVKDFCGRCGISAADFDKVVSGDTSFEIDVLFKIARFLEIKPTCLINEEISE